LKKTVSLVLALALLSLGTPSGLIGSAAQETISIKSDGSIEPASAPISSIDNITYVFLSDIYGGLAVYRSNIVLDGAGHTIEGNGDGTGLSLLGVYCVTVKRVNVKGFHYGIYLESVRYSLITGNNVTANSYDGIRLRASCRNIVSQNGVTGSNQDGIKLNSSDYNTVSENTIASNKDDGIQLYSSSDNMIYGNNITVSGKAGVHINYSQENTVYENNIANNSRYGIYMNEDADANYVRGNNITANRIGINSYHSMSNTIFQNSFSGNYHLQALKNHGSAHWDNGTIGNYWSDYNGTDFFDDGIGDIPYEIPRTYENEPIEWDRYPLMKPFTFDNPLWRDSSPPILSLTSPRNTTYATKNVVLAFMPDEPVAWVGYSVDRQSNVTLFGNTTLVDLPEGAHTLAVYANDTSGNVGRSTVDFTIDTLTPSAPLLDWLTVALGAALVISLIVTGVLIRRKKLGKETDTEFHTIQSSPRKRHKIRAFPIILLDKPDSHPFRSLFSQFATHEFASTDSTTSLFETVNNRGERAHRLEKCVLCIFVVQVFGNVY